MRYKKLFILAMTLATSVNVVADSEKWSEGKQHGATEPDGIVAFDTYGQFVWGDDYFSTLKKICEIDSIHSIAIDTEKWWISDGLKSQLQEVETQDSGYENDFFIARERACKDNFFLRNAFPGRFYSKTNMNAAKLKDSPLLFSATPITIIAKSVSVAGMNFIIKFSFGLKLPESYGFYMSQHSKTPNESSLILYRSDWLPELPNDFGQPSALASAGFGEPISACHNRTETTVATMASIATSMGNELEESSYEQMTIAMKAVCNCTYDSIASSQFTNHSGAKEDFSIIENYLMKEQFSSAPDYLGDIIRQALIMKLNTGEQALVVYGSSMQSCLSKIDAADEVPQVVWVDPLLKTPSEDLPGKVAFDVPFRAAFPLTQIILHAQGNEGLTAEQQEAVFQKVNASIVGKYAHLPSARKSNDCYNATNIRKNGAMYERAGISIEDQLERSGIDTRINKGAYYLSKPVASERDMRNAAVRFCDPDKELPLRIYGYKNSTSPVYSKANSRYGVLNVFYNLPASYYEKWNAVYESEYPTQPKVTDDGLDDL